MEAERLILLIGPTYEPPELEVVLKSMERLITAQVRPRPVLGSPPPAPPLPELITPDQLFPSVFLSERSRLDRLGVTLRRDIANARAAIAAGPEKTRKRAVRWLNLRIPELSKLQSERSEKLLQIRTIALTSIQKEALRDVLARDASLLGRLDRWWEDRLRHAANAEAAEKEWSLNRFTDEAQLQLKVLNRLRAETKHAHSGTLLATSIRAARIPWRLLPPPDLTNGGLERFTEHLSKSCPGIDFDLDRLHFAFSLKPIAVYIGSNEFDGYLAFRFSWTMLTLLECPVEGNAAYIIKDEWQTLSKFSKSELLQHYTGVACRVIHFHNQAWKHEVKRLLGHHEG